MRPGRLAARGRQPDLFEERQRPVCTQTDAAANCLGKLLSSHLRLAPKDCSGCLLDPLARPISDVTTSVRARFRRVDAAARINGALEGPRLREPEVRERVAVGPGPPERSLRSHVLWKLSHRGAERLLDLRSDFQRAVPACARQPVEQSVPIVRPLPVTCVDLRRRLPLHGATSLATASRFWSGARCAYLSVIAMLPCPSNSRTVLSGTPAWASRLAK